MKKLKILLAVCSLGLSLFLMSPMQISNTTDAAVVSKPSIVEWDTANKIIYANLNSLLIVEDNGGTTVYLDLPSGGSLAESYQTGDGVLTDDDLSLAEIYALTPTAFETEAPADGANLSDWSIVLGANNLDGTIQSAQKMLLTMTGGSINAIYNGCSSFQAECISTVNGSIEVNISGGNIVTIHTDFGYMNEYGGDAHGSNSIVFNLTGGTIQTIARGNASRYNYGSVVNLGGSIKVVQGIDMSKYVKGTMINLTSQLEDSASLQFNVGTGFVRSNELFTVKDATLLESLDLNKISVSNAPESATDWIIYKNASTVRYGYNVEVESVEISGVYKVGETLTLNYSPTTASFKSIAWYTINETNNESVLLSTGFSYKLSANEGGEYIYVKAIDKNNNENIFEIRSTSVVQKVEKPSIVGQNGLVYIYANGNDLIVAGDEDGTTVYIDLGTVGELDNMDISLKEAGVTNAYDDDSDLSFVVICAGCANGEDTGNVNITMLSGHIKQIISKSKKDDLIYGYVNINLYGGTVDVVAPNTSAVNGFVSVNLSGNPVAKIYAPTATLGGDEIRLVGEFTGDDGSISILLDGAILNGNVCIESDDEQFINANKFKFEYENGNAINDIRLLKLYDGAHRLVYDVTKVDAIRVSGKVRVGETITVETNPLNSYISVKWYRSSADTFYFATLIEGASGTSYTLTDADEGMYIFVEVVDGYGYDFDAMTATKVAPKKLSAGVISVLVIAIVIAVIIIAFVVWFILWKNLIVGGVFITPTFEKIDQMFFKSKKSSDAEKPKGENLKVEKKNAETKKEENTKPNVKKK